MARTGEPGPRGISCFFVEKVCNAYLIPSLNYWWSWHALDTSNISCESCCFFYCNCGSEAECWFCTQFYQSNFIAHQLVFIILLTNKFIKPCLQLLMWTLVGFCYNAVLVWHKLEMKSLGELTRIIEGWCLCAYRKVRVYLLGGKKTSLDGDLNLRQQFVPIQPCYFTHVPGDLCWILKMLHWVDCLLDTTWTT